MSGRNWIGAVALIALATSGAIAGQAKRVGKDDRAGLAATETPPTLAHTQALADRYVAEGKAAGIVFAVAHGDSPTLFASAGRLSYDAAAPKADPDSLWRVYSMTKPLTGMAAMILIEEGKLKLDQPISDFIPAFKDMKVLTDPANSLASRPAARPITVRNLLTHTAGLGYSIITKGPLLKEYERLGINPASIAVGPEAQARPIRPASLEEFANRAASLPLIADPGTVWSYSIGLDVLGRVIEVASGMPFDAFLKARIFTPLKMQSSYFTVPASDVARLTTNYFWAGENHLPLDPGDKSVFATPPSFPYGGAGLVMSARDYDRFLHMLQNEGTLDGVRVMKEETVRLAMSDLLPKGVPFGGIGGVTGGTTGPKLGFGAGGSVYLEDAPGGAGKGTYGWGGAAGTIAWVDPTRDVRGTVMVNYMPADKWPLRADTVTALYADFGQ
jgi:CubicO group peptidase (beta-lactamase class C family)